MWLGNLQIHVVFRTRRFRRRIIRDSKVFVSIRVDFYFKDKDAEEKDM